MGFHYQVPVACLLSGGEGGEGGGGEFSTQNRGNFGLCLSDGDPYNPQSSEIGRYFFFA